MSKSNRYLFVPLSSPGYLFPAIKLAQLLQQQNHQVLFAATADYQLDLQLQGIETIAIRNDGAPFLQPASWFQHELAPNEVKVILQIAEHFKPDYIVANPLVLCGFVVAEILNLPLINIGFSEYLYPGLNHTGFNKNWRLKSITDYYNAYRAVIGKAPVPYDIEHSPLIGDRYLLRTIPELCDHLQLPAQVQCVGSLYFEPAYTNIPLQQFITRGKAQGLPLVYVQIGRLFEDRQLWQKLLWCLERTACSVIVDTGRADYLTGQMRLPSHFFAAPFIPIGAYAQDIDFVICSGQSTSMLSAICHGKQILCLPHAADAQELCQLYTSKGLALSINQSNTMQVEQFQQAFQQLLSGMLLPQVLQYQQLFERYQEEQILAALPSQDEQQPTPQPATVSA